MNPVRLAVVGVGHLGRHHARVASQLPGARCVGVFDHHPGRAEEVGRELGVAVLPDLDAVAAEAEAAILATPTVTHESLAVRLIEAGLDVLVEKPLASTLEGADAILAAARSAGRLVGVGHIERHNPAVAAALGAVPEPRYLEAHRLSAFKPRGLDVDVVLDLMIHDLQIARFLAGGPAVEVQAAGTPVVTNLVDVANARILFEGGLVANLTASRVSAKGVRRLSLFAPSLSVAVDMQARSVRAFRVEKAREGGGLKPFEVRVGDGEPLALEQADFIRAVRERRPPLVSGEEGRDALALAESVQRAVEASGSRPSPVGVTV